jgi:hypothetical protein
MTGNTSNKRAPLPDSAVSVAMAKRELGMKRAVVPVSGSSSEIVVKGSAGKYAHRTGAVIVVRRKGRGGGLNAKATALKGCGGLRDGAFKTCVGSALGRAPRAFIEHSGANVSARRIV